MFQGSENIMISTLNDNKSDFICNSCIGYTLERGEIKYNQFNKFSLAYYKKWNQLHYYDKLIFIVSHIDGSIFKFFLKWYDTITMQWNIGQINKILSIDKGSCELVLSNKKTTIIYLKSMNEGQYTLFQSPAHQFGRNMKFINGFCMFNDEDFNLNVNDNYFNDWTHSNNMLLKSNNTKININAMIPIILTSNGDQVLIALQKILHCKKIYEFLQNKKFI
jgi:hypothetical protein